MPVKDSYCSYCGTPFGAGLAWPRTCTTCTQISYVNPLPVAVTLLPVDDGLLVIRRTIEPQSGRLALPGGFIDLGEGWQEAAARELREEAGALVDPAELTLFDVRSAPAFLIVFALAPRVTVRDLPPSVPTDETSGWELLHDAAKLAFPLHRAVAAAFFSA
jgi:ADP-ribose pyrophosphatase YjhB (NUDIX family)